MQGRDGLIDTLMAGVDGFQGLLMKFQALKPHSSNKTS